MTRILGVDGGGTGTRAALVDERGRVLGCGASGPGNLRDVGPEALERHLREAAAGAFAAAGAMSGPADVAFLGLASVVGDADRATAAACAVRAGLAPTGRVIVDHDLRVAHAGALAGRAGIVLIAGTGSSCYGRDESGREARAGGLGSLFDDGGGAFDLGRRALAAVARAEDGRGPGTALSLAVLTAVGAAEVRDLVRLTAPGGPLGRPAIASLARVVTEGAAAGDRVARELLEKGAEELAACVAAVARRLAWERPQVALVGGLAARATTYRDIVEAAIARDLAGARVVEPVLSPVLGAALLARAALGEPAPDGFVDTLRASGGAGAP